MYTVYIIAGINVIYIRIHKYLYVFIYANVKICVYVNTYICVYIYICTHVNNDDPKGNVAMKLLLKGVSQTAFSNQGVSVCGLSFFRALSTCGK